jgi:hypothetical protein
MFVVLFVVFSSQVCSRDHSEVEIILETYLRKIDELENEVKTNVKSITLTEEHIQIRLDTTRNTIMKMELLLSVCTFGVTTGALGASLFGKSYIISHTNISYCLLFFYFLFLFYIHV